MVTLHHRPHRLLLDPSGSSGLSSSSSSSSTTPDAANGSRTRGTYTNEANFDTNMVIILAALLCALIFALGLNSIVRCALRCSRRFSFETPDETAARLAATGLKKSTLRQIPIVAYGSGANIPATDCPICLGEFQDGQKVRLLPKCNHGFHVRCIDTWFLSHSSCPTCRHSLLEQPAAASDSAEVADARHTAGNASSGGQGDVPISVDEAS
ncbi:unnamed protein product [Prunus armeniaca]|uniref:RING-type E3 ubiquitin transferase n=1 Tax=Prunus armeniaca TaxID=36596 RepID=A0A6J5WIN2_PRUAR|nr:hypothetical protein GBA52_006518 [Prunus armeniaca]CAB4301520.1 unnamed protein product [Prunus armeniaca]